MKVYHFCEQWSTGMGHNSFPDLFPLSLLDYFVDRRPGAFFLCIILLGAALSLLEYQGSLYTFDLL